MKSPASSATVLQTLLSSGGGVSVAFLAEMPSGETATPVTDGGMRPAPVLSWSILVGADSATATIATPISFPKITGDKSVTLAAWAIIGSDSKWRYAQLLPAPFILRPGDILEILPGDLVVKEL